MSYQAKILKDSVSEDGNRLTTMEVTYPRFIHSEIMTHRVFSRNTASSRAIPIQKMLERVIQDPVIPIYWGKNQKGMQATEELSGQEKEQAIASWLMARDQAVVTAKELLNNKVHKQITNRILEPFMWITAIITATEWTNFYNLRCHKDAQPEIRKIAEMMREAQQASIPNLIKFGDWHLPLIFPEDLFEKEGTELYKVSAGRCARVSYLTHDNKRDLAADVELAARLLQDGHMSPMEHPAIPYDYQTMKDIKVANGFINNFKGWVQYREFIE